MALDSALEQAGQNGPLTAERRQVVLADLEVRLGYAFKEPAILVHALTHVGAAKARVASYQRLEFLGDRVLGVAVAAMLYTAFPHAEEGELSVRLAALVRRETCAAVALAWDVEPHVRLGLGEKKALRRVVRGDVCEAIIGAVFIDGGFEAAQALVQRSFESHMRTPSRPLRDSKTALQEWAQARGLTAPVYRERGRSGPDHAPEFTVAVVIDTHAEAEAKGASKRLAEQAAAAAFMLREGLAPAEDA